MISWRELGCIKENPKSAPQPNVETRKAALAALHKALIGKSLTSAEKAVCRTAYWESLYPSTVYGVNPYQWVEDGCKPVR